MSDPVPTGSVKGRGPREHEYEITFTLAAGYEEQDALDLYEYVERHPSVDGAALAGSPLVSGEPGQARGSE